MSMNISDVAQFDHGGAGLYNDDAVLKQRREDFGV